MKNRPKLQFVSSPKQLPPPPLTGRVVTLDLAFAAGDWFERSTRPFILELGMRLARWIDHHPHPAWDEYEGDPRFLLVDKQQAPACPQLVTPELVAEIGPVEHLIAHADFDGMLSAAKFLRGGTEPYAGADEDGRAIDAPGQGYVCSARGMRLARAMERSGDAHRSKHGDFAIQMAHALVEGTEPAALAATIDKYAAQAQERQEELRILLDDAVRDHPSILLLRLPRTVSASDKKNLLRELEESATLALIEEPAALTAATYDARLKLTQVSGLHGTDGLAWGKARYDDVREELIEMVEGLE